MRGQSPSGSDPEGLAAVYHAQKLGSGTRILAERADHLASYHRDVGFMNATRRHALMYSFDDR